MKILGIATLALFVVIALATPEDELIDGTKIFTAKLYQELIKIKPNENIVFSPITVQTLMGLIASAAVNEDEEVIKEIVTVLSLPRGDVNRQKAFKSVLESLNESDNDFKVFDATKMYLKNGYSVKDWYETIAKNFYKAEIETVNFGDSLGTSQNINQWVEAKTNGNIKKLVDDTDISTDTEIILINTLFLSGKWDKPFLKKETVEKTFHTPTGKQQVPMMINTKTYEYSEDNNAQYIKLKMLRAAGDAEMVIALPKQPQGLTAIEPDVQNLLKPAKFQVCKVQLTLPKFSISSDMKLQESLNNIGVTRLFRWGAKLRGLTYPDHEFTTVTNVLQKAFIDVDEWGVTAAVVGEMDVTVDDTKCDHVFTADHPFLFYIIVDEAIVYAGRVMKIR